MKRESAAEIRARDLFTTYSCCPDPALRKAFDKTFADLSRQARVKARSGPKLWADGSFSPRTGAAGIGVRIEYPGFPPAMLAKSVKAASSEEAEAWAIAVAICCLLDSFPPAASALLRYDCESLPLTAVGNRDLPASEPWTNLTSAMRRAKRAGTTLVFEHVKGHASDTAHNLCDLAARRAANIPVPAEKLSLLNAELEHRMPKKREKEKQK